MNTTAGSDSLTPDPQADRTGVTRLASDPDGGSDRNRDAVVRAAGRGRP
jgi:hypothetical protein